MENEFFVVEHDPAGDVLRAYEGLSQDAVIALLQPSGHPFEFISEDDYASRLAIQQAQQTEKG